MNKPNPANARLNLDQLRIQAKELLKAVKAAEPAAIQRTKPYFKPQDEFKLAQAQLVIARENGFASWANLKLALGSTKTDIFQAIDRLDSDLVQEILAQDPNQAGSRRRTEYGSWESPLHVAAKRGSLEIAKLLVEAGAEVYALAQSDYPPVFEAHYGGNRELVDYLLQASVERDNGQPPTYGCGIDIVCASRIGMIDRVQMHLTRDPFAIYRRGCIGETVLHWPAHNGFVEVVELLIQAGAVVDADEIGLYGGKPIHWAAEHSPSTLKVLLKYGANPNARNIFPGEFEGYTPLHMCARQREECVENAEMLLAAGADIKTIDAKGQTALEIARLNGRQKMARFLGGSALADH